MVALLVGTTWLSNILVLSSYDRELAFWLGGTEIIFAVVTFMAYAAGRADGTHVEGQAPPA